MNKKELIDALSQECSHSKSVIEAVLDAQGVVTGKALAKGGEVTLPGIGKLSVNKRAARTGRNPKTGVERKSEGLRHRRTIKRR